MYLFAGRVSVLAFALLEDCYLRKSIVESRKERWSVERCGVGGGYGEGVMFVAVVRTTWIDLLKENDAEICASWLLYLLDALSACLDIKTARQEWFFTRVFIYPSPASLDYPWTSGHNTTSSSSPQRPF